jgi:hypothetical protein
VSYARDRGAITILRVYEEDQRLAGTARDRFIDRVVRRMEELPAMMVAEGYNEAFQSGIELARRAEFDIELMRTMAAMGRKAAIGSFSTGTPEISDWHYYLLALKHAASHQHFVALHEYGGPVMQWGCGMNQWRTGDWILGDPCTRSDVLGWWCLRYRRHVAEWRRLGVDPIPRILITEGGLDDVYPRPGPPAKGYKDWEAAGWGHGAPGGHDFGDYADQWRWYCDRLSEDSFVAGAVDFGFATQDPAWDSFDLSTDPAMLERFAAVMRPAPEPPSPDPIPDPSPPIPHPEGRKLLVSVHRGDGYWSIARELYHTSGPALTRDVAALMDANGHRSLRPGDHIKVPWRRVIRELDE